MTRTDELSLLAADLGRLNTQILSLKRAGVRVLGVDLRNPYPVIECAAHPALTRLLPDTPCYAWGVGPHGRWSRYCGIRDGIHIRWKAIGSPAPNPDRRPIRRAPERPPERRKPRLKVVS